MPRCVAKSLTEKSAALRLSTNVLVSHNAQRAVDKMNAFRLVGDLFHLAAICSLITKIWTSRTVMGLSGKSQFLGALVFTTRYVDMLVKFTSPYNTLMKVFFLLCSWATVNMVYGKFKPTYDELNDSFRIEILVVPCGALACLVNHDYSPVEVLWTFSMYLESVAILPQLFMLSKTGAADVITTHYLFLIGCYRVLYVLNWIYRFYTEHYFDLIAVVAGVTQTVLYLDFFYLYITKEDIILGTELPPSTEEVDKDEGSTGDQHPAEEDDKSE